MYFLLFYLFMVFFMNRRPMSRSSSRRSFTKGATRVHSYNIVKSPMRGGIRM